jgi:hypothetical protein
MPRICVPDFGNEMRAFQSINRGKPFGDWREFAEGDDTLTMATISSHAAWRVFALHSLNKRASQKNSLKVAYR